MTAAVATKRRLSPVAAYINPLWEKDHPERGQRRDHLEGMTAFNTWGLRVVNAVKNGLVTDSQFQLPDGRVVVFRSVPQIRAGVEKAQRELAHAGQFSAAFWRPLDGKSAESSGYWKHVQRQLRYAHEVDLVSAWSTRYDGREPVGIEIVWTEAAVATSGIAGGGKLPRTARRAGAPPPGRVRAASGIDLRGFGPADSTDEVPTPSGLPLRRRSPSEPRSSVGDGCARTRSEGTNDGAGSAGVDALGEQRSRDRGRAIEALVNCSSTAEGPSAAALREAALAGADPLAVVLAAWTVFFPHQHPALTRKRREQLLSTMRLVDRLRGRSTQPKVGAGAAELVEMLAERDAYASDDDPIRSLGFFVWTLRRRARAERRHAAGKPPWTEKHLLDRHGNPTVVRNDWHDERADRLGPARAAAAERKFRGRPRGSSC